MRRRSAYAAVVATFCVAAIAIVAAKQFFGATPKSPLQSPSPAPAPAYPAHAVIGTSVQGRNIDAYTYGSGRTHLLMVGGIHGGYEWNSAALAYQLMGYLASNRSAIPPSLSVTIIPDLNPDAVFKVVGRQGPFTITDVPVGEDLSADRFNADGVDLNRNFDCAWQATSTWQNKTVSAGTAPFSEPEAAALREYVLWFEPVAVVLWHSKANGVYGSHCGGGILPGTIELMDAYARGSGYPAIKTFDAYPTTGAAEDWLALIGIPAVTVELSSHNEVEWERNLSGVEALFSLYGGTASPATTPSSM